MQLNRYSIYGFMCGTVTVILVQQYIRISTPPTPNYSYLRIPIPLRPEILWQATSVKAYRVVDNEAYQYNEYCQQLYNQRRLTHATPRPGFEIDGCRVVEGPINLPKEFATRLKSTLVAPGQFMDNTTVFTSDPSPNVIFIMTQGRQTQEIRICVTGGDIGSLIYTNVGRPTTSMYGQFGPDFLSLAKQAFPNDADLKGEHIINF
jgi:hypothetical protein